MYLVTQILEKWQDSSHTCVMLTGDAPLTALSVAVEVRLDEWKFPNTQGLPLIFYKVCEENFPTCF